MTRHSLLLIGGLSLVLRNEKLPLDIRTAQKETPA